MGPVDDDNELFLVDCGIETLGNVYLTLPELKTLNVHSNYLTRIENLSSLISLTHLDLSSNQISRIEGLNYLVNLKTLNLSCNIITIVEGLTNLVNLTCLNLSYNQIINLSGLKRLPANNCLHTLQLQGNMLADMNHILLCVKSCQHIACLVLEDGAHATNPVCSNLNYRNLIQNHISSITRMDKPSPEDDDSDLSNPAPTSAFPTSDSKISVLSTPRIDAVLSRFHKALDGKNNTPTVSTDTSPRVVDSSTPHTGDHCEEVSADSYDQEKKSLESQLAELEKQLLRKKIQAAQLELQGHDISSSPPVKHTESDPAFTSKSSDEDPVKEQPTKSISNADVNIASKLPRKQKVSCKNLVSDKARSKSGCKSTVSADVMYRDAVSSTYQQLLKDLDAERLRRTKAEDAASKLANQIKQIQSDANSQVLSMRNCDDVIKKLHKELTNYKDDKIQLEEANEKSKERLREAEVELKRLRKTCTAQERAIRHLEEMQDKLEKLQVDSERKHSEELEKMQKSELDQKELLHAAQANIKAQRQELDSMRSLLAAREEEHRRDMEHRYTLDSPKLEELFQSKITSLVREHAAERKEFEYRIDQCAKEYADLEDEFRMALHIEADRFNTLQTAYEELSLKQANQEKAVVAYQEKDSRASKMISELTQLVKEQKDKLIATSKEKQDLATKVQNAKAKYEQEITELTAKIKDIDRLKKDNIELKNQVQGQHSIISGLRKERELWSKELAQQGAALSSERGSLESRIGTLSAENKTLKQNLETEVDTVKIKTKIIADVTETVSTLKKKLTEIEADCKTKEKLLQTIKDDHLKELEDERRHSADLEAEVDALMKRKEELKEQLQQTEDELNALKESHRSLKAKWQDKSATISGIEEQIRKMNEDWQLKEKKLSDERDKAVTAADLAVQRLKAADDGFRKQLEAKEVSHADRLREMTDQYELRIAEEQHRLEMVEEEMRDLLLEKENNKKIFEAKIKKVTKAFMDLQQDV